MLSFESNYSERIFFDALSAARVYYWARYYEAGAPDELARLFDDRDRLGASEDLLRLEINRILGRWGADSASDAFGDPLKNIRQLALEKIARLEKVAIERKR
jgi:hypothetical protein